MSVIDESVLGQILELEDTQPGFFRQVLQVYETTAKESLATIEDANQNGNLSALRNKAHGLKGTSANIGAQTVSQVCKQIVESADRGETVAGQVLTTLNCEVERSLKELFSRVPHK